MVFGSLSDKIGRKWIMIVGMLAGILLYRPIFSTFKEDTNVKEWIAQGVTVLKQDSSTTTNDQQIISKVLNACKSQLRYAKGSSMTEEFYTAVIQPN